jgi:hypothetical protein
VRAFVKVDHTIRRQVQAGCVLFGGVWVGVWLPNSAKRQTGPGKVWDVSSGPDAQPGSWGGHAITVVGYDRDGLTLFTWGAEQRMTWAFWNFYVDEAYCLLSEDWFRKSGTTSRGFNVMQLQAWLDQLG